MIRPAFFLTTAFCIAVLVSPIPGIGDTSFTYQGELKDNGALANGAFNMDFSLWDAASGGNQVGSTQSLVGVPVSDGKFAAQLDFGAVPYTSGPPVWLEISVGGTTLAPRTQLTSAPFSLATRGIEVDAIGNVGIGNSTPQRVAVGNEAYFGLGSGPYPSYDRLFDTSHRITDFSSSAFWSPLLSVITLDPLNTMSGSQVYANSFEVHTETTNNEDFALVNGLFGATIHKGNGTMFNAYGGFMHSGNEGAGDISGNIGLVVTAGSAPGATGSITDNRGISVRTIHRGSSGFQTTDNYGIHVGTPLGTEPIESNYGIYVEDQNVGVGTSYAIFTRAGRVRFNDDLEVTGTVSKGGGSFKIDHPLDPANKYLYHSFVESPDMMNIYNGNITTDARGYATIEMPEWFEALNREFRYQLTVIDHQDNDEFTMVKVVEEIQDNGFRIRTSAAHTDVSWQVTGVRQDPFAEANRIPLEEDKADHEVGHYLHPEAYGLGREFSTDSARQPPKATTPVHLPKRLP